MLNYWCESRTIDHCPACGTLQVLMDSSYMVVAKNVETAAICTHSYAERRAMNEAAFATLHLEARQERESRRRRVHRERSHQLKSAVRETR